MEHYFAPCPRGLSAVLADELKVLGASEVSAQEAGVAFEGDKALGYLPICIRVWPAASCSE